jgi:hypothetical protein
MNNNPFKQHFRPLASLSLMALMMTLFISCKPGSDTTGQKSVQETILTNPEGSGSLIEVSFAKGSSHNHPLMVIWMEDMDGKFIQTLFVSKSIATGIFNFGTEQGGKWQPGERRRPAALPYWGHKRGIAAADGLFVPDAGTAVPDAYSGPTPKGDFILRTRSDNGIPGPFRVLLELNQPWDWNTYWNNSRYPDDEDYKSSSQPALVYEAMVNPSKPGDYIPMQLIGHSHYSGKDGKLYTDLSTITTAKEIVKELKVRMLE